MRKKQETIRKDVRGSLINQLKSKGADIPLYTDKIEDYMALWDQKEMYIQDIRENGVRLENGKQNSSTRLLQQTIRLMDTMLKTMNLSPDDVAPEGDEDEL